MQDSSENSKSRPNGGDVPDKEGSREVTINTTCEHPYPIKDLGENLPGKPCYQTLWRYANTGITHRDKTSVVKLETVLIGGRMHSTVEAFHRMIAKANQRQGEN